jgi:hypothetical protein
MFKVPVTLTAAVLVWQAPTSETVTVCEPAGSPVAKEPVCAEGDHV